MRPRMTRLRFGLTLIALVVGCDAERHLIGDTRDGATEVGPSGTGGGAGSLDGGTGGTAPLGGTGGALGSGGSSGTGAGLGTGGGLGTAGTGGAPNTNARALPHGGRVAVTSLARLLWQTAPDAALLAMADSGAVSTTEDLRQLALRMLTDDRAQSGVGAFFRWWLDLDAIAAVTKDPAWFPQFNAALATAMASEPETFGVSVTLDGDGLFSTLLTAPYTFMNDALAGVYGIDGITGTALRRVALDPTLRQGLLTQPGFMALNAHLNETAPTERGRFVLNKFLCTNVPAPPASEGMPVVRSPTNPATTRSLVTAATSSAVCVSCHRIMDSVGFGFEHYDAIGSYRSSELGLPIDTTGAVTVLASGNATFDGAPQLAGILAVAPEARDCISRMWVEYAIGRALTTEDVAAVTDAERWFAAAGYNLRDLIAGGVQTDLFLTTPPICTPGSDLTCNTNPAQTSASGHCTETARCTCTNGAPLAATGHCP